MSDPTPLILKMSADISQMQKQISAAVGVVDAGSAKMVLRSKEAAAAIEKSFGTVTVDGFKTALAEVAALQDRLTAAQLAGNAEEAKALRAELLLRGAVQKAAVAQLETQLAIARAAGNKGQIAQLTEALALQSQISKFQGVGLTGVKALHEAEAAVVALGAAEKTVEAANVGKALDKVFDSSKLAVMEEGGAKIRIFGSALEPLGAYGIAAAAGIVAVAAAGEQARKAMEWADDLDRTAKKLGTTTTSLQSFDYASIATSIGLEQGREAMSSFNGEIGKFETHTGDKRLQKWADAVHLTRDQVNQTVDPVEKLALVMDKIAKLPDAQSRTSAAKAFGLDGLLPIINEGSEGIDKFIAKMKEARDNGSIIDPREIAKAAELNDKVEELTYRIGIDFKKAFIDAAPAIESVAEFIERCTHALSDFASQIPLAIRGISDLIEKATHLPSINISQNLKAAAGRATLDLVPGGRQLADLSHAAAGAFRSAVENGRTAELRDKVTNLLGGGKVDLTGSDFDPALTNQKPGQQLTFDKPPKGKSGPRDDTAQRQAEVNAQLDTAERDLLQAWSSLILGADQQADLQKQIIDVDQKILNDKLDKQEADIRADKGIGDAKKDELVASLESVRVQQANVADLKKELIDRDRDEKKRADALKLTDNEFDLQTQVLSIQEGLATTAKARRDIELRLLDLADQREKADLDAVLASKTASEADKKIAQAKLDALDATRGAREQQVIRNTQSPVEQFVFDNTDAKKSAEDFQRITVSAFDNLNSGLAEVIAKGGKFSDVLRSVVQQMLIDVTKQNLARAEASLLSKAGIGVAKAPEAVAAEAAAAPLSTAITTASSTGATTMGTEITTSGTSAATAMGTAITTAGAEVAAQLAAAMAAGGAGGSEGGGLGFISSFLKGGGSDPAAGLTLGNGPLNFDFSTASLGFADGTDGAPGGWARINERGPEGLAFLPPGTKVIPNDVMRGLSKMAQQPSSQSYAPTLNLHVYPQPGMTGADARRTGSQVGSAAMQQMAKARKAGI